MRILLVQSAPFENGRLGLENALWLSEPAALTSIAAMVQDEHEVKILDMRLEEAFAERPLDFVCTAHGGPTPEGRARELLADVAQRCRD